MLFFCKSLLFYADRTLLLLTISRTFFSLDYIRYYAVGRFIIKSLPSYPYAFFWIKSSSGFSSWSLENNSELSSSLLSLSVLQNYLWIPLSASNFYFEGVSSCFSSWIFNKSFLSRQVALSAFIKL